MADHNSLKTTGILKYLPAVLVVAGQASVILSLRFEEAMPWLLALGMALAATGLGLRARSVGRRVVSWVIMGIVFPLLVPLVGFAFMVIKGKKGEAVSPSGAKPVSIPAHAATAFILFLLAALFMDSLSLALISFVIAVIWVSTRKEDRYKGRVRLAVIGVYALMVVMVFAMKGINYRVSQANARVIIEACERYKGRTGEYPAGLRDLVPAYLPEVPVARYTVMSGGFYYHRNLGPSGSDYRLVFVYESPFARSVYSSVDRGWRSID
ncbi:MAG TPA: hypothetical protein PKN85_03630 [Syntrophorhabdaceae bacterium]|nr:hypothetical protein [Syntrophorhabdaceae bacterium]HOD75245.1 hypothetical protein [Syntrophorhabdaceae bacterium]